MKRSTLSLLLLACACGDVPVDDLEIFGGTAPEPTGVIRGTVLYNGPPPICVENADGDLEPLGNVVLTLFEYDNPPPPTGSASSAENLITIPGLSLFTGVEDCLPEDPQPEDFTFITRTAEFTWPEIGLRELDPATGRVIVSGDYQIRGFYDYDGNFNPFFSVSNLPTRGDVAGGAFVDPSAELREFRRLSFDSGEEQPNGQVLNGVSVALGAPVNTARPVFYMTSDALDSAATIPIADPITRENAIFAQTNTTFSLYDAVDDASSFEILAQAFAAAGMDLDGPKGFAIGDRESQVPHAWYVREVDADGDGNADLHPILGAGGAFWLTPIILMQRNRTPLELEAGIPDVLMIPTVSNVDFQFNLQKVYDDDIRVGIPAIGAVTLNPADARCRIPYIPSGNAAGIYDRITVECQEVPTGDYNVNVLQGLAGARPVGGDPGALRMCRPGDFGTVDAPPFLAEDGCFDYPETRPERELQIERCNADNMCEVPNYLSPVDAMPPRDRGTGWELEGGSFASQAWGIPNAFGDPTQLPDLLTVDGDPNNLTPEGVVLVEEQGVGGRFTVAERDPSGLDGSGDCSMATDSDTGEVRAIEYKVFDEYGAEAEALRALCCATVEHLCGVPLCPLSDGDPNTPDGDSVANPSARIYGTPTSVDEDGRPDCVPFEMPDFCCPDPVP